MDHSRLVAGLSVHMNWSWMMASFLKHICNVHFVCFEYLRHFLWVGTWVNVVILCAKVHLTAKFLRYSSVTVFPALELQLYFCIKISACRLCRILTNAVLMYVHVCCVCYQHLYPGDFSLSPSTLMSQFLICKMSYFAWTSSRDT